MKGLHYLIREGIKLMISTWFRDFVTDSTMIKLDMIKIITELHALPLSCFMFAFHQFFYHMGLKLFFYHVGLKIFLSHWSEDFFITWVWRSLDFLNEMVHCPHLYFLQYACACVVSDGVLYTCSDCENKFIEWPPIEARSNRKIDTEEVFSYEFWAPKQEKIHH